MNIWLKTIVFMFTFFIYYYYLRRSHFWLDNLNLRWLNKQFNKGKVVQKMNTFYKYKGVFKRMNKK